MREYTTTVNNFDELQALCSRITQGEVISDHHFNEQLAVGAVLPFMCTRLSCEFPITLVHRDKPDFIITWGRISIGLEVTRLLAPASAHARATARRLNVGFMPSKYRFSSPILPRARMEGSVASQQIVGLTAFKPIFDPEDAEQLISIIKEKNKKILLDADIITDENWLIIEDCHHMCEPELRYVISECRSNLDDHWRQIRHFSKIIILSDRFLVEMDSININYLELPNRC